MAFLAVRVVRYQGEEYSYQSPRLKDGLNILEGDNEAGKSTFANLIYYGLGGRVPSFSPDSTKKHREVCGDKGNYVELTVEIDAVEYVLTRFIGTNDIGIAHGTDVTVLPINRQAGERVFSDWMLERLGIEAVTLQYGTYTGKLNFTDLMRLIYHDQALDPSAVYKASDRDSFVTDSREFRRAAFEILVGKSFQDYYSTLARFRAKDREKGEATKALEMFKEFAHTIRGDAEDMNLVFLDGKIKELTDQVSRLQLFRESLAKAPPRAGAPEFASKQAELLDAQLALGRFGRREMELLEELSRLEYAKSELIVEATQIKKMMFAHDNLKLFSSNTCPYCLRDVTRVHGKCVCGADVDEADYERFFYDADEYLVILKSRQKNVETVNEAIKAVRVELDTCRASKVEANARAESITKEMRELVGASDFVINVKQFEDVELQIGRVREELARVQRQREVEEKRQALEQSVNSISTEWRNLKLKVEELAIQAEKDIAEKTTLFSAKYSEMLTKTLKNVRVAYLDGEFMPVINQGEYGAASNEVPRRLLYFCTLLHLSLVDSEIKFPRFLLVDTPETAGIDLDNLKNSIDRVLEVVDSPEGRKVGCQVILTTGLGKYPDKAKSFVFATLTKEKRLLQRRSDTSATA